MCSRENEMKVSVVIPCYRGKDTILDVIDSVPDHVYQIIVVDDACPEATGNWVEQNSQDPRVIVEYLDENQGVGGAVVAGWELGIQNGADILVKIDADGQMDPALTNAITRPIENQEADFVKGNRFSCLDTFRDMPFVRKLGNIGLTLLNRFSSGYYRVSDPTNGFVAIHSEAASSLPTEKLDRRYFFESDLLYQLQLLNAKVSEIPHYSIYNNEVSSLDPAKEIGRFFKSNIRNFFKRVGYQYLLRDFSVGSLYLIFGVLALGFGIIGAGSVWLSSVASGQLSTGGTLAILQILILIGAFLLFSFLNFDMNKEPTTPIHPTLSLLPQKPMRQRIITSPLEPETASTNPMEMLTRWMNASGPLIVLAIFAVVFWVTFFVNPISRSFWYDEVHIAWLISGKSMAEIATMDFVDSIGRPPVYLLLAKLATMLGNSEAIIRALNILPMSVAMYYTLKIAAGTKSTWAAVFLSVLIFLSDDYIYLTSMFKPYAFDVAAALMIVYWVGVKNITEAPAVVFLKYFLAISVLSLFGHQTWVAAAVVSLMWLVVRCLNVNILGAIRELIDAARNNHITVVTTICIWAFNLQFVLRAFSGGKADWMYSYVVREQLETGELGLVGTFVASLSILPELFMQLALLNVSSDMPFHLFGLDVRQLLVFIPGAAILLGILLNPKHRLTVFVVSYFLLTIVLSLTVSWPFDTERWSMGLIVYLIAPGVLLFQRAPQIGKRMLSIAMVVFFLGQYPFLSHPNGTNFFAENYWQSRGQPTTDSLEIIRHLNDDANPETEAIVMTANANKFYTYYTQYHDRSWQLSNLQNAEVILMHPTKTDKLREDVQKAGRDVVYVEIHSMRNVPTVRDALNADCIPGKETIGTLNNERLFRVGSFSYDCVKTP